MPISAFEPTPSIQNALAYVAAEGNEVVLRGVTHDPAEHKRIEEAARQVAGAVPVRCDLHYRR